MVLLREDPPVPARHASEIEEHAATEPCRLVRRHRDQRLDGRRITHQAAPEDGSPDRAEDSVGADDVSGFEHAARRRDHDAITGLLHPDERRAALKSCAGRDRFLQEEVVELRPQNECPAPARPGPSRLCPGSGRSETRLSHDVARPEPTSNGSNSIVLLDSPPPHTLSRGNVALSMMVTSKPPRASR